MKKMVIGSIVTLLHTQIMAQPCTAVMGQLNCKDQQLSELRHQGRVLLDGVKVLGGTGVQGALTTSGSVFQGPIQMDGLLEMRQTTAQKNLHCRGLVNAHGSRFGGDLDIQGREMHLHDSQAKNIRMKHNHDPITLYLTGKTTVAGNVVFDGGPGRVVKDKTAHINGRVTGGTVEEQT